MQDVARPDKVGYCLVGDRCDVRREQRGGRGFVTHVRLGRRMIVDGSCGDGGRRGSGGPLGGG